MRPREKLRRKMATETRSYPALPTLPDAPEVRAAVAAFTHLYSLGLSWSGADVVGNAQREAACRKCERHLTALNRAGYGDAAKALDEWYGDSV